MNRTSIRLSIGGMSCAHCEQTIEKGLLKLGGVETVAASFGKGTADVVFDADRVSRLQIEETVASLGYTAEGGKQRTVPKARRTAGLLLVIAALFILLQTTGAINYLVPSRLAQAGMSFGMLFVIGLITSVHCVAMCGGINLSQCVTAGEAPAGKGAALKPAILYNAGRVISYTVIGFAVGALGGVITFSPAAQGALKLLAGLFMVLMGINMLGIFPWLRRLNPRLPKFIAKRIDAQKWRSNSPLVVGLLNGLMPCGPLQAMQIYALSTGSAFSGALSMLLFSLGTVPLMFGLGALSSVLSRKFTRRVLAVGAILVVVLGLSMLSQGLALTEVPSFTASAQSETVTNPEIGAAADPAAVSGVQVIQSTLASSAYPNITVQAGIPVQWTITAPQGSINGCNERLYIPEYNIEYTFVQGDNLIEFTPTNTGTFQYTCWMGMIRATITVTEPNADPTAQASAAQGTPILPQTGESSSPTPAGYVIPTETLAVAEQSTDEAGNPLQRVEITLTDTGFSPAVVVAQNGVNMEWTIVNATAADTALWVPDYAAQLTLLAGTNRQFVIPTADFAFSDGAQAFYGYVKVVDDVNTADLDGIRAEVAQYQTLTYPVAYFQSASGGSCCSP
jgi:uncharacterized protein